MGLTFTVGNPSDVFAERYAEPVRASLAEAFGPAVVLDSAEPPYRSDETAWSGWERLQRRAAGALGPGRVPHLLAMEAWSGGYVPAPLEPTAFPIPGSPDPLAVASLAGLVAELEAVGAALGLPTDDAGLRQLAGRYDEDEAVDDDVEVQTYAELLLAARVAVRRRQVLWVVK